MLKWRNERSYEPSRYVVWFFVFRHLICPCHTAVNSQYAINSYLVIQMQDAARAAAGLPPLARGTSGKLFLLHTSAEFFHFMCFCLDLTENGFSILVSQNSNKSNSQDER